MARPRSRSDDVILLAARTVLIERGSAAPIRAMAAKSGLTPSAVLARFGSRDGLVRAALAQPSLAPALAPMLVDPAGADIAAQLRVILDALSRWHADALPCMMASRATPPDRSAPRAAAADAEPRLHHALAIWLARAQALGAVVQGDSHAIAGLILAALQGQAAAQTLPLEGSTAPAGQLEALLVRLLTSGEAQGAGSTRR